jgi:hypothetical protein
MDTKDTACSWRFPGVLERCSEGDGLDAIEAGVTHEVSSRRARSRSGLGSVEAAAVFADRVAAVASRRVRVH